MKVVLIIIACIFFFAFKYGNEEFFKVPKGWPKPSYNFNNNALTKQKIELGRALFYEPKLSSDNTISCASCHSQYSSFTHIDHALSHGIDDKIGTRNAPVLINLAWQKLFMHDGAVNHLDVQALSPMSNPLEMNENISHVVQKLQQSKRFRFLFFNAFNDSVITGERTLKALSQFMLTFVSANSKYDSVMNRQKKFSPQEENGYQLFKKHCSVCHAEPLFTNYQFMNNGLPIAPTLNDVGRYGITKQPSDSLKFKVPTLRNIEFSYPYMHDGRFKKLSDVLNHYTSGIIKNKTLAPSLQKPLTFTSNQKVDLIAFLLTLSDKSFLFNPNYSYPKTIPLQQAKE